MISMSYIGICGIPPINFFVVYDFCMAITWGIGCIFAWVVKMVDFRPPLWFVSDKELWIFSCEEAIQLVYEPSVVLPRRQFVPEIMHGRVPKVFLYQ
jgi:hypothetical protein